MAEQPTPSNTPTSYPTELKLENGEILSVSANPQLKQFFEQTVTHAQKQTKDQLYARINKLETDLNISTSQLREAMALVQDQENAHNSRQDELRRQMEDRNREQTQGMNKEELRSIMKELFDQALPAAMRPLQDRTINLEQQRVAEFKNKLLNENAGSIVPELIQGDTIEKLLQSVEVAKSAYHNIRTTIAPVTQPAATPQVQPVVEPVVTPQQTTMPQFNRQPIPQDDALDIKNMSDDEFKNNREDILRKLKAKVGQS